MGRKQIGAGDRIFLYTEDLIERRNREGALFGLDRLLARIGKDRGASPATALSSLLEWAMEFEEGAAPVEDVGLPGLELT
jgi:serine phosphatase RsbU (regulator of sigma subunit)